MKTNGKHRQLTTSSKRLEKCIALNYYSLVMANNMPITTARIQDKTDNNEINQLLSFPCIRK